MPTFPIGTIVYFRHASTPYIVRELSSGKNDGLEYVYIQGQDGADYGTWHFVSTVNLTTTNPRCPHCGFITLHTADCPNATDADRANQARINAPMVPVAIDPDPDYPMCAWCGGVSVLDSTVPCDRCERESGRGRCSNGDCDGYPVDSRGWCRKCLDAWDADIEASFTPR